jgi:hypothetical protein
MAFATAIAVAGVQGGLADRSIDNCAQFDTRYAAASHTFGDKPTHQAALNYIDQTKGRMCLIALLLVVCGN